MQFFLYEIVGRTIAASLCFDTYRTIHRGLMDERFVPFEPDAVNWILDSFRDKAALTIYRDATPLRFWVSVGLGVLLLLGCLYVATFGWPQTGNLVTAVPFAQMTNKRDTALPAHDRKVSLADEVFVAPEPGCEAVSETLRPLRSTAENLLGL